MAGIYNANRFGGKAVSPQDFNPFAKRKPLTRISDPRLIALEDGSEVYTVK